MSFCGSAFPFLCSKGRQIPTIRGGTGTDQRIVGHFIGFQGVPGVHTHDVLLDLKVGNYWKTRTQQKMLLTKLLLHRV